MDQIRTRQTQVVAPLAAPGCAPPMHQPEMLYVGCVDARLDPIDDIGIGKGKALIFRNIGALVLKNEDSSTPQTVSIGAVLEFFLNHIPAAPGIIKHIVISGHTDCGGMKACLGGICGEHDHYLPLYLESLKAVRSSIIEEARLRGWSEEEALHALERAAVRQSMDNLITYPAVRSALDEKRLKLHGWVIDTATQRISEMNPHTREFEPMTEEAPGRERRWWRFWG